MTENTRYKNFLEEEKDGNSKSRKWFLQIGADETYYSPTFVSYNCEWVMELLPYKVKNEKYFSLFLKIVKLEGEAIDITFSFTIMYKSEFCRKAYTHQYSSNSRRKGSSQFIAQSIFDFEDDDILTLITVRFIKEETIKKKANPKVKPASSLQKHPLDKNKRTGSNTKELEPEKKRKLKVDDLVKNCKEDLGAHLIKTSPRHSSPTGSSSAKLSAYPSKKSCATSGKAVSEENYCSPPNLPPTTCSSKLTSKIEGSKLPSSFVGPVFAPVVPEFSRNSVSSARAHLQQSSSLQSSLPGCSSVNWSGYSIKKSYAKSGRPGDRVIPRASGYTKCSNDRGYGQDDNISWKCSKVGRYGRDDDRSLKRSNDARYGRDEHRSQKRSKDDVFTDKDESVDTFQTYDYERCECTRKNLSDKNEEKKLGGLGQGVNQMCEMLKKFEKRRNDGKNGYCADKDEPDITYVMNQVLFGGYRQHEC